LNQASYIFGSTPDTAELERLRAIETIFVLSCTIIAPMTS